VPAVALGSWDIDGLDKVGSPEQAVTRALELAGADRAVGERT
jgi:hypothetical protein